MKLERLVPPCGWNNCIIIALSVCIWCVYVCSVCACMRMCTVCACMLYLLLLRGAASQQHVEQDVGQQVDGHLVVVLDDEATAGEHLAG